MNLICMYTVCKIVIWLLTAKIILIRYVSNYKTIIPLILLLIGFIYSFLSYKMVGRELVCSWHYLNSSLAVSSYYDIAILFPADSRNKLIHIFLFPKTKLEDCYYTQQKKVK